MADPENSTVQTQILPSNGHPSNDSQTASEFINNQLQLEADAREALPYSFQHCTQPLGPLRQSVFSCLTCNPPPTSLTDPYTPAGVCYACSIACHGEHDLVELFNRRNFTCDCGTTRLPVTSPCTLRIDPATGMKGPVHSQDASAGNTYNKNFRNIFCGCDELYNPHKQKGVMYQCLGLKTESDGGCGEDWWHPECLLGVPRDWYQSSEKRDPTNDTDNAESPDVKPELGDDEEDEDHPTPPGFPDEDDFETLICYKCTNSSPWIKQYGNTDGFTYRTYGVTETKPGSVKLNETTLQTEAGSLESRITGVPLSKKRKADEEDSDAGHLSHKRQKSEPEEDAKSIAPAISTCRKLGLPPAPIGSISLFAGDEDFRSTFCRCPNCYPSISEFPQLLEEEETYEPPISDEGDGAEGGGSVGTGSLLDRGEAALSNMDRVKAIEGVMVYNHLKDKVKSFLQPFAESGQVVGAEDIKAYFEKLRGDAEAIKAAGGAALATAASGDNRKEGEGY